MDEVIKGIIEMKADEVRSFIIEENGEYFELNIKKNGDLIYPKDTIENFGWKKDKQEKWVNNNEKGV